MLDYFRNKKSIMKKRDTSCGTVAENRSVCRSLGMKEIIFSMSSETHIQQAVSFIKNKNLQTFNTGRKIRCVLKMILKPSRGGNKNLFD
jgi:hypothetical protein